MLQLIYQGKLVSSDMSEFALDLMKGQHDDAGLLEGLPVGSVFAHKTGTLDGVFNDGALCSTESLCDGGSFQRCRKVAGPGLHG